jgi:hypothetical protein
MPVKLKLFDPRMGYWDLTSFCFWRVSASFSWWWCMGGRHCRGTQNRSCGVQGREGWCWGDPSIFWVHGEPRSAQPCTPWTAQGQQWATVLGVWSVYSSCDSFDKSTSVAWSRPDLAPLLPSVSESPQKFHLDMSCFLCAGALLSKLCRADPKDPCSFLKGDIWKHGCRARFGSVPAVWPG